MDQAQRITFAHGLLAALSAPATPANVAFLLSWMDQENTRAAFNPLATTQRMDGATAFNSAGVRNYLSMEQGITAQAKTLRNGRYPTILQGLQAGAPERAANGPAETKVYTGSESYFSRIVAGARKYLSGIPIPEPKTIAVSGLAVGLAVFLVVLLIRRGNDA